MSSYFNMFWTPASAGVTIRGSFYETINFWQAKISVYLELLAKS